MVTLDVLSLLEKKGKTKYWLYHQLGMSYQNFSRMVNNETKSIRYENIEALCQNAPPTTSSASPKIKTTAIAVVFCCPAASAAMPPPQAVHRRAIVTRASRSRARLISATNSRRFVAKPRTPHPIPQAAQLFKCRSANVRGRGARPLVLSLGGLRGILSFSKESIPLYPCSAKRCSPRGTSAAASFALVQKREKRKQKAPAEIGEGFLLCCVYF